MQPVRQVGVFLFILGAIALVGCPRPATPSAGDATGSPGGKSRSATTRVAVVVDTGGIDDQSFNSAANAGLQRAIKELTADGKLVEGKPIESKQAADYKTNIMNAAAQGNDLVVAVGDNMETALADVAPQFPNVKFAIVDGRAPKGAPNCVSLQFKEEQGTFLAGYLAASVSKTKRIGFVGGMQIPLIQKFESGYRAGAKTAGFDPNTQVLAAYTGDWVDLAKGKQTADQEFAAGADIIFQAAGKSGLGVLQAAKEKGPGFFAIGVDQDQDGIEPGRILTSMVKHVDTAVFDTIKRVRDGQFEAGEHIYDLKEGGIGLSQMKYTKQDVPADVLAKVQRLSDLISADKLKLPTRLEEVAAFQPPKL